MTPLSLLEAVQTLLASPAEWLPVAGDREAVDAAGAEVSPRDPAAQRWSVYGALSLLAGYEGRCADAVHGLIARVLGQPVLHEVFAWEVTSTWENEPARTHAEVLEVLRSAIALTSVPQAPEVAGEAGR